MVLDAGPDAFRDVALVSLVVGSLFWVNNAGSGASAGPLIGFDLLCLLDISASLVSMFASAFSLSMSRTVLT